MIQRQERFAYKWDKWENSDVYVGARFLNGCVMLTRYTITSRDHHVAAIRNWEQERKAK